MERQSLDIYDDIPMAMKAYLRHYGYHFNRKAYEYAVSMMRKKDESSGKKVKVQPYKKEEVDELLNRFAIKLENDMLYDSAYVYAMARADYMGSSIPDEQHLALHIKDVIDDVDAADGEVFTKWYASMVRRGCPIEWEDLL